MGDQDHPSIYRDFFVSYSTRDEAWARWLVRRLEDEGFTCWVAFRDFHDDFKQHMQEGLLHCRFVLAVLSRDYLKSRQCSEEWRSALEEEKLIVLRVEEVHTQGLLRTRIFADLFHNDEQKAIEQLLGHVNKRLTARPINVRPEPIAPDNAPFPINDAANKKTAARSLSRKRHSISRRNFLALLGVTGIGSIVWITSHLARPPKIHVVKQWKAHDGIVFDLTFTPDGEYLLSSSDDGVISLWRLSIAEKVRQFVGHENSVLVLAMSPDGREFVSGSTDRSARSWRLLSGDQVRRFDFGEGSVRALQYMPDGHSVVMAAGDFGRSLPIVQLIDLDTGKISQHFEGHAAVVTSLAVSPDGKWVLSGSDDRTVRLWEVSSGETLKVLKGFRGDVSSLAFSPDGKSAISGSSQVLPPDHEIRLWDLSTGKQVLTLVGHDDAVHDLAFLRNGRHILSASSDLTVRLWDIGRGQEIAIVSSLQHKIWSLAVSPLQVAGDWDVVLGDHAGVITHLRLSGV